VRAVRREGNIVSYTFDELREMRERGEDLTDWERVRALTDEEIEAAIDVEDEGEFDWENAIPVSIILDPKRQITIRLDQDVLDWFKSKGEGYQTRINAVLRSYVEAEKKAGAEDLRPARHKAS
jgi:uncharacterized protein (DUF4415 family)